MWLIFIFISYFVFLEIIKDILIIHLDFKEFTSLMFVQEENVFFGNIQKHG